MELRAPLIAIFSSLFLIFFPLEGSYTLKKGKFLPTKELTTLSAQEHYTFLLAALQEENWQTVEYQSTLLIKNFPDSPFYQEAVYYLASAHFYQQDYDLANQYLTEYLQHQTVLKHFYEALELKFQIAEKFRLGSKKHLGGFSFLPKCISAKEEALAIYEEVINTLPNDDLAAKSLFGKAVLLMEEGEYTASIEAHQALIRHFPKHPITPNAYLEIGKTYLIESQQKSPDADYLELALINLKKFRQDFPNDSRLTQAEALFAEMQEEYAKSFYEIAQFYERTHKKQAAILYHSKIIKTFPNTKTALLSKKKIKKLQGTPSQIPAASSKIAPHESADSSSPPSS